MNIIVDVAAEDDMSRASFWYDSRREGYGLYFDSDARQLFQRL